MLKRLDQDIKQRYLFEFNNFPDEELRGLYFTERKRIRLEASLGLVLIAALAIMNHYVEHWFYPVAICLVVVVLLLRFWVVGLLQKTIIEEIGRREKRNNGH